MKKSIFIAVIGMAAAAASSYGQGFVTFSSYAANAPTGALTTFNGTPIGIPFEADLYFALGTVSDPVGGNIISAPSAAFTDLGTFVAYDNSGEATGGPGLGFFDGGAVQIPGYVSGPITWEVVAFNGSSYANSSIRGRSGSFTDSSIANSASAPLTTIGDNTVGGMPNFVVAPVPEPTTLALAGLGGLASLVAMRRKNA